MSGGIYLIQDDGELVEMNERGYDTEDLLQGYLADHPDLLAGDAFVPRLIGQTAQAERTKSVGAGASRQWDQESFFRELEAQAPKAIKPARAIFEWAGRETSRVSWGKGKHYGSFSPKLDHNGTAHSLLEVGTKGDLYIQLGDPQSYTLLGEQSKRSELLLRLEGIPGITLSVQPTERWARSQ